MNFASKLIDPIIQSFQYVTGNLRVLTITDMLMNFSRRLVFPYASLYILALGGNATQIGLISFLSMVAGLFLLPVAGHITDHADRIRLLVLAGFLSTAFLVLNVIAPTWQVVALATLLSGLVVFQFPAYASLVADALVPGRRGQGIGMSSTISSSLSLVAPFLAGLVVDRFGTNLGLRILYGVMVILSLVTTLIQRRFLRETTSAPREPLHLNALLNSLRHSYRGIPDLVRSMSGSLRALALVIMLCFVTQGLVGSFWVVYAVDQIGLTGAQWGLTLLAESVVGIPLFIPAGILADRWGRTASLTLALILSTVASLLFVILHGFIAILILRAVLAACFVLGAASCVALMAELVPSDSRGKMMAAIGQGGIQLGTVGNPGGPGVGYLMVPPVMIAALAGGFLYSLNPVYPWIVATATGILAAVLTVVFVRSPTEKV
ncbi:MAG: MFS transporter [Anaerolineales bacterium]|nr:MFS transporter [Anaerolineales bacterium]